MPGHEPLQKVFGTTETKGSSMSLRTPFPFAILLLLASPVSAEEMELAVNKTVADEELETLVKGSPDYTKVILRDASALTDLGPLRKLGDLQHLEIYNIQKIENLKALARLKDLTCLRLEEGDEHPLKKFKYLGKLKNLQTLRLRHCRNLDDLRWIADLSGLKTVYLEDCDGIKDIGPLGNLGGLTELSLLESDKFASVDPLTRSKKLLKLYLPDRFKTDRDKLRRLNAASPALFIEMRQTVLD